MATQTLSNDDIIEAIGNLSVVELAELIEKFKEKFGVTIAAPVAAAPAAAGAAGGAAGAAAGEGKTQVPGILKGGGGEKNPVIKEIPAVTKPGLKKAKELGGGAAGTGQGGGAKPDAGVRVPPAAGREGRRAHRRRTGAGVQGRVPDPGRERELLPRVREVRARGAEVLGRGVHRAGHDLFGAAEGDAAAGGHGRGGRDRQDQAPQEHHREGSLSR